MAKETDPKTPVSRLPPPPESDSKRIFFPILFKPSFYVKQGQVQKTKMSLSAVT